MPVNFLDLPKSADSNVKPSSPVVWTVFLVVAIAVGIALTLTLWPKDRSPQCWQFYTWTFGVPSVCWVILLAGRIHILETTLLQAQGVTISDGSGAYIKLSGGNIEIGGPGTLRYRVASFSRSGPSSLHQQYQSQKRLNDLHVTYHDADENPIAGEVLNLLKGDGSPLNLTTAGDGRASQLQTAFDYFKAQLPKLLEGNRE